MAAMTTTAERPATARLDLDRRPMLVFWEATRACGLACRHCRADAQTTPVPGELTTAEAERFIDSLGVFGRPAPVLVITGGDALMRADLDRIVAHAHDAGIHVALAPSVTPLLTDTRLAELRGLGVKVASLSIDGASPATHDAMRGIQGHLDASTDAIRRMRAHDFVVQINTTVTPANVHELPAVAELLLANDANIWEVFFLVNVGRGVALAELSPDEHEDVCQFLYDASEYGFIVRTVEGPMFRRIVRWRADGVIGPTGPLYRRLHDELVERLGPPIGSSRAQARGTRDGRGIVFVSSTGDITPAGFLPLVLGNVRTTPLAEVYRDHPVMRRLRGADFSGPCGVCDHRDLCGGSRSRAYAATGDPFASDPACAYASAFW
jgi:AdoMet-dependent heme synthase